MKQLPATTEQVERPNASTAMVEDIKNNFGIDVGEIAGSIARDYVKENVFGRKSTTPAGRSKFAKALFGISEFFRSVWWVPAAAYAAMMLVVIAVRLLANIAGVEV
ncbi:hypothetical protein J2755_000666 [Methanohalophilus levihalophilus]|uniref:hypothetical protein n=1 Tax=Methanohalophilus levihalophilus TaxID=1431282 RepID=UPI001AE42CB6|nr:hypothetical protein [Methanohalophilus levihalophilus]MBP2029746.1 hypothetical protein [Methanohalophilus levihalophilus]